MTLAVQPAEWHLDALCAQVDGETWFPEQGKSCRDAKRICRACPVRAECLQYSLDNDERFGIWGGLSERERRRLRKGDLSVLSDNPLWRCEVCGEELAFKGRVCSAECRHQLSLEERLPRECGECGEPIPNVSRRYKFCSVKCRQKSYDRKRPVRTSTRKTCCKHCGTVFPASRNARYCSPECRRQGFTGYKQTPRSHTCAECRTEFMACGRALYCSASCRDRVYYRRRQGMTA